MWTVYGFSVGKSKSAPKNSSCLVWAITYTTGLTTVGPACVQTEGPKGEKPLSGFSVCWVGFRHFIFNPYMFSLSILLKLRKNHRNATVWEVREIPVTVTTAACCWLKRGWRECRDWTIQEMCCKTQRPQSAVRSFMRGKTVLTVPMCRWLGSCLFTLP